MKLSPALLLLTPVALAALLSGCGPGVPADPTARVGVTGSSPPGPTPAPTRVVQRPPPRYTPSRGRTPPPTPPSLAGAGGASRAGPTSKLPPPADSSDLVSSLEGRYQLRILGPGASPDNLKLLERGLADFRPEQLAGLAEINFPLVRGVQPLQGLWESDGRRATIKLYAQAGRPRQVFLHTISHELGHQTSLLSRRTWGSALDRALGEVTASYPSEYSRTQSAEKVAETIAFSLLGPEDEQRPLPSWNPSLAARDLLRQEFGARLKL